MNWRKILLAVVGAGFAGSLGQWGNATLGGQHVPFTAGTIVLPAVTTIVATLAALFTKPPHQP